MNRYYSGRSFAEYWKYFVARFNDVHAFGYNFTGSERIWMKFGEFRVYCLKLDLTDFGRDPRRRESGRPCGSLVFLSGKQRTTLPIFGQPNFTKFAHKTWFCDVVNPFGIIFWRFALKKGSFFKKNRDHRQRFPTSSRDFSEMITNPGKSWQFGRLWNVGFPSVPLESTQSHSPGQQAPYEKGLFDFTGHRRLFRLVLQT